jgi:hypothetical protein
MDEAARPRQIGAESRSSGLEIESRRQGRRRERRQHLVVGGDAGRMGIDIEALGENLLGDVLGEIGALRVALILRLDQLALDDDGVARGIGGERRESAGAWGGQGLVRREAGLAAEAGAKAASPARLGRGGEKRRQEDGASK